jgi:hypothetical protein
MGAKHGVKKGSNSHSTYDLIDGPAHRDSYERKELRVVHRAINHLNGTFALSPEFIPWLKNITEIPETNLRRWQKMLRRDPMWQPWHTDAVRHKIIFSGDEEAVLVSFMVDNFIAPG